MDLPSSILRTRWTRSPAILQQMQDYKPAPFGRIKHLKGKLHAIDVCHREGKLDAVHVALLQDHPILRKLPPNTPRAVKSCYRKDTRLKHYKATDAFTVLRELDSAEEAWEAFKAKTRKVSQ